jgi:fructoselysine-6-P-deglycase FrlB-like protein
VTFWGNVLLLLLLSTGSSDEDARLKLQKALQARTDELVTQRAVNQQLMLKKEDVEWQLMAAIAQVRLQLLYVMLLYVVSGMLPFSWLCLWYWCCCCCFVG